eukprot:PhM_4_TR93/c0_g1_i1/m.22999
MDVLQTLSESDLHLLRKAFDRNPNGALPFEQFVELLQAMPNPALQQIATLERLREMFDEVDFNGDGDLTWEELSMYLINEAMGQTHSLNEFERMRDYIVAASLATDVPDSIKGLLFIPEKNRMVQIVRTGRISRLRYSALSDADTLRSGTPFPSAMTLQHQYQEQQLLRRPVAGLHMTAATNAAGLLAPPVHWDCERHASCRFLATAYVPPFDVLAAATSDVHLSLFDMKCDDPTVWAKPLPRTRRIALDESLTVLKWNDKYRRLMSGSRSGIVTAWSLDHGIVAEDSDRLHELSVTDLLNYGDNILTSSLDTTIKMTDIIREQVMVTLKGHHEKGVNRITLWEEAGCVFSAGLETDPLAWVLKMPAKKPVRLVDKLRPHRGAIIGLHHVPRTFQLLSADTKGTIKVWDVRTYACIDTKTVNTRNGHSPLTAFSYLPEHKSIIVAGRGLTVLRYNDMQHPHDADDVACHHVLYNEGTHTFLTVHRSSLKSWDMAGKVMSGTESVCDDDVTSICLEPRGRRAFLGTSKGVILVVNITSGDVLLSLNMREFLLDPRGGASSHDVNDDSKKTAAADFADSMNLDCDGASSSGGADVHAEILSLSYAFIGTHEARFVISVCRSGVYLLPDTNINMQRGHTSMFPLRCINGLLAEGSSEVQSVHVFDGGRKLAVTMDSSCVYIVNVDDYSIYGKVQTTVPDFVVGCAMLVPLPFIVLMYGTGQLSLVPLESVEEHKRKDDSIKPVFGTPFTWSHTDNSIAITGIVYAQQCELLVVADDKGNLVTYDVHTIVHETDAVPSANIAQRWTASKDEPITDLCLWKWGPEDSEVGVLCAQLNGKVHGFGLLGTPLGHLAQGRGVSTQVKRTDLFACDAQKAAASSEVVEYLASHRGNVRGVSSLLQAQSTCFLNDDGMQRGTTMAAIETFLPSIPKRNSSRQSSLFLTETVESYTPVPSSTVPALNLGPSPSQLAQPQQLANTARVGPARPNRLHVLSDKYTSALTTRTTTMTTTTAGTTPRIQHPTALRPIAPAVPSVLGTTPRPPPARVPAVDASVCSSYPSDLQPSHGIRTRYRAAEPTKPVTMISSRAKKLFKQMGMHHEEGVSQVRRTLRDEGSVVLGDGPGERDGPSQRQLFPSTL